MFILHRPAGAKEDTRYEFRPEKVLTSKASIAERLYSKACGERRTWEQLVADATQGGIAARRVVLWLAITADHPFAKFADLPDLEVGQIGMEYSKQELRLMRDGIKESTQMLDSEKEAILTQMDRQIEEAQAGSDEPDPQPELEEEPGKDHAELSTS
jgi:hypothetical protein